MEKYDKTKISGISNTSLQEKFKKVIYVPPEKERISLTQHRHVNGGTTIPK